MRDGYYTAEAAGYDEEGWKDFLTIYVSDDSIVTVEFNARNSAGFIRSWDLDYQRGLRARTGITTGIYTRIYSSELRTSQNPAMVLAMSGAEKPHKAFRLLAEAAIVQAKAGDKAVAVIDLSNIKAENR
jgi:major membrane immunogen (membrane-anchored lipoprotein)